MPFLSHYTPSDPYPLLHKFVSCLDNSCLNTHTRTHTSSGPSWGMFGTLDIRWEKKFDYQEREKDVSFFSNIGRRTNINLTLYVKWKIIFHSQDT